MTQPCRSNTDYMVQVFQHGTLSRKEYVIGSSSNDDGGGGGGDSCGDYMKDGDGNFYFQR